MNHPTHPVEQEEVMAYLDGELPVARATAVAAHLNECAECQALAGELRLASERLAAWQVEPSPARLSERVVKAAEEQGRKAPAPAKPPQFVRPRPSPRQWVWGLAAASAAFLILAALAIPNLLRSRQAAIMASKRAVGSGGQTTLPEAGVVGGELGPTDRLTRGGGEGGSQPPAYATPQAPMIVRTASLSLISSDFDGTRDAIEHIVRLHRGYIAQLTAGGAAGSGRSLTATLRVPSDQLDTVVVEIKKLGRVERESQSGEEVTEQYVDLTARLGNARVTEQRLTQILQERTGRVADVLAVEREIARVRGEIERMEAEKKNLEGRVGFATLQLQVREEYKAELQMTLPSTLTQLWNALVDGYRSLRESILGLILFLLSYGPVLAFWGALLYFPGRWAWRRLRTST